MNRSIRRGKLRIRKDLEGFIAFNKCGCDSFFPRLRRMRIGGDERCVDRQMGSKKWRSIVVGTVRGFKFVSFRYYVYRCVSWPRLAKWNPMETDNVGNVLANQVNRNTIVGNITRLGYPKRFGFKEEFYFRVELGGKEDRSGKFIRER